MASLKYAVDIDTRNARSSIGQLEKSIGGLGAAVAGGFAVGNVVAFGDSIIGLQNKLRSLTGSQMAVGSMFNDITRIAGAARAPLQETGDLYFRIARAAADLGISQKQTADITESLAKSMSMTGATAAETSGALLQLGQALQSGRFQGDELRSVLENMPIVSKAMADELGVTIGELRKLGSEGKITSDVFVRAMQKNKKAIDDAFARSVPTAQQALNNLKTSAAIAFDELANEPGIGQALIKAGAAVLKLTNDVNAMADAIKTATNFALTFGTIWLGLKGPLLAKAAVGALNAQMLGLARSSATFTTDIAKGFSSIRNGLVGIGVGFGVFDKGRGSITRHAESLKGLSGIITRMAQVVNSLGTLLGGVLKVGLRFAGWIGIFMAVVDVINLLYQAVTGSNKKLIDMGKIFKFLYDLVRVVWAGIKALGGVIKSLGEMVGLTANSFAGFVTSLGLAGIMVKTVIGWVSNLWGYLGEFWNWLKEKSGVAAEDRAAQKASADKILKDAMNKPISDTISQWETDQASLGKPGLKPRRKPGADTTGGGGKSAKEIAKEQAEALGEVKKAVLEVTAAYREQASARLEDLNFQLRSLSMSEDQVQLEQSRKDILNEQKDALKQLAEKELEVKNSKDLSNKGRQEALALIAQEKASIETATEAQLAAAEKEIKAIQAKNREIEKNNHLLDLQQKAAENRAALQSIEDQLQLVGLYGDELDNVTAQLELQNRLREIDVDFQGQLIDLKKEEIKLGAELYNQRKSQILENRDLAIAAATQEQIAKKKISDAIKKSERTDVSAAIRKRLEELARSVDPTVLAVQSLESAFSNMSSAIDNFVDTGKFKFGDFARSVIADIAKIQLKAAATKILGGIFSKIFAPSVSSLIPTGSKLTSLLPASFKPAGYAAGGPVKGNNPILVGEQGPELFVPNSNGSIMTNASLNKNAGLGAAQPVVNNTYITNNISAIDSRSVAQMFVENRKALLGASVMARKEMPYGS